MTPLLNKLEKTLEPIYKSVPSLPPKGREGLAKAMPVLALVFGILQIVSFIGLWRLAHSTNEFVDYANQLSRNYGSGEMVNHLGLFYWIALLTILLDAVILLVAYPALRDRKKQGWDLLFLATTVNLVYGLLATFDGTYGGVSKLFGALIGSAIAYYFVFQVREYYMPKAKPHHFSTKKPAK